ncbi:MAG: hypothetical protein KIS92_02640 [Planctomycetota bacterium]|nr:hypothetical protein [Planctomycetota bacterium]
MIDTISGDLSFNRDGSLCIDCGGIGYRVETSKETRDALKNIYPNGGPMSRRLYCSVMKREQAPDVLIGFHTEELREFFCDLIKTPKVGPRTALNIMCLGTVQELKAAIILQDIRILMRAAGVSDQVAKSICLKLSKPYAKARGPVELFQEEK